LILGCSWSLHCLMLLFLLQQNVLMISYF
jgi:hypothetical protein